MTPVALTSASSCGVSPAAAQKVTTMPHSTAALRLNMDEDPPASLREEAGRDVRDGVALQKSQMSAGGQDGQMRLGLNVLKRFDGAGLVERIVARDDNLHLLIQPRENLRQLTHVHQIVAGN